MKYIKNLIFIFYGEKEAEEGLNFLIECKNIFLNYIVISFIVGLTFFVVMEGLAVFLMLFLTE